MKGFLLRLGLKERHKRTRKWPILRWLIQINVNELSKFIALSASFSAFFYICNASLRNQSFKQKRFSSCFPFGIENR